MFTFKPLPKNIQQLLPRAQAYLRSRSDCSFAYLFGGLAQGVSKPLSDVDIAVFLSAEDPGTEKKMEILSDLTDYLKTDEVDLVVLNTAPLRLRMRVLKSGKLLVDNAPYERQKYESLTIRQYLDFSIREQAILERRFLNG